MIGKGAQYLTAAGFGRYRITAASLGSLDLLGTFQWLTAATKQAIMDAFGVDGTAVIRATNDYLNGIAASDMAKATALAGFINEDPMMVCSLVETPKDRKIVIPNAASSTGQNNKLFLDNIKMNQIGKVVMGIQRLTYTSGMGYLVVLANGMTPACGIGYNDLGATFSPALSGQNSWKKVVDQTITFTSSNTNRVAFFLYSQRDTNWTDDGGCTYIQVYGRDLTTLLIHLIPFKRNGNMYFMDLLAVGDETKTLLYSTSGSASPYEQITDKNTEAPYT